MASQTPLDERVEELIIANLRDELPYMKIDAVRKAAKASVQLMMKKVQDQQAEMQETKERSSFMTLPPELRTRVYELALRPDNDGDGGIPESRAIFTSIDCEVEYRTESNLGFDVTSWATQPALSKVSRQIREEALSVYYGVNNFVAECYADEPAESCSEDGNARKPKRWDIDLKGTEGWLRRIGSKNVALIKHFDVCFDDNTSLSVTLGRSEIAEHLNDYHFKGCQIPVPEKMSFLTMFRVEDRWIWKPVGSELPADVKPPVRRARSSGPTWSQWSLHPERPQKKKQEEDDDEDDDGDDRERREGEVEAENLLGTTETSMAYRWML